MNQNIWPVHRTGMQSQHLVLLVQYRPQVHIYLEIYYLLFWHIQRTSELKLSASHQNKHERQQQVMQDLFYSSL